MGASAHRARPAAGPGVAIRRPIGTPANTLAAAATRSSPRRKKANAGCTASPTMPSPNTESALAGRMAGAAVRGVEGHLRHAPHVDAGRRQDRARPEPRRSITAGRLPSTSRRAAFARGSSSHAERLVHHRVRLRRSPAGDRDIGRRASHVAARATIGGRVLPRGDDARWTRWVCRYGSGRCRGDSRRQSDSSSTPCITATIGRTSNAGGEFSYRCTRCSRTCRCAFIGKCSPVHFFWGGFDLAVTRFSGRPAPPRKARRSCARRTRTR